MAGRKVKIGIDPGVGGAIAFIFDDEIKVYDMPVKLQAWSAKDVKMVDQRSLYDMIKLAPYDIQSIAIEIVHSMPKQGVASTWAFSGAFYSAISVLEILGEPYHMLLPSQWKKKWGLINTPKDMARLAVLKMYPHLAETLKRKKDVDRADAILIASSVP